MYEFMKCQSNPTLQRPSVEWVDFPHSPKPSVPLRFSCSPPCALSSVLTLCVLPCLAAAFLPIFPFHSLQVYLIGYIVRSQVVSFSFSCVALVTSSCMRSHSTPQTSAFWTLQAAKPRSVMRKGQELWLDPSSVPSWALLCTTLRVHPRVPGFFLHCSTGSADIFQGASAEGRGFLHCTFPRLFLMYCSFRWVPWHVRRTLASVVSSIPLLVRYAMRSTLHNTVCSSMAPCWVPSHIPRALVVRARLKAILVCCPNDICVLRTRDRRPTSKNTVKCCLV